MKLESAKGFYVVLSKEDLKLGLAWQNKRDKCWRLNISDNKTLTFPKFQQLKEHVEGLDHG